MMTSMWMWIWLIVVLKIPFLIAAYVIWWAVKNPPDQVIGDVVNDRINYSLSPRAH